MGEIIKFEPTYNLYFNRGTKALADGNFFDAIKNISKAIELCDNLFLKCSYNLVLAQAYSKVSLFELSNKCLFKALDFDTFMQVSFLALGENFMLLHDDNMSNFYLNQCMNLFENNQVSKKAKFVLEQGLPKTNRFRIVKSFEETENDKHMKDAENHMVRGHFNKAVQSYEMVNEKFLSEHLKEKYRSGLSLAYYFTGETQKGIQLSVDIENKNIGDLCNLMLFYFSEGDNNKYEEAKEQLLSMPIMSKEQNIKIGITFAQTKEHNLAQKYIAKFMAEFGYEIEFMLLYAIASINCKDYDEAKEYLLKLIVLNPENAFIFKKYLNYCEKKTQKELEYLFGVQISEYSKINHTINEWLDMDIDLLEKVAVQNIDFLNYIARNIVGKTRNIILLKLCEIERPVLIKFFNDILIDNEIDKNLKILILNKRMEKLYIARNNLVIDNFFIPVSVPALRSLKGKNPTLFEACLLATEFLADNFVGLSINIKKEVSTVLKRLETEDVQLSKYQLACVVIWLFVRDRKICTIKRICNHFIISEEEFFAALDKLKLEI